MNVYGSLEGRQTILGLKTVSHFVMSMLFVIQILTPPIKLRQPPTFSFFPKTTIIYSSKYWYVYLWAMLENRFVIISLSFRMYELRSSLHWHVSRAKEMNMPNLSIFSGWKYSYINVLLDFTSGIPLNFVMFFHMTCFC